MSVPAFAQIAQTARVTSPTSPMTLAFSTQNLTAGSYLLAYVWLENTTTITPTLTDNSSGGSNTWTQLKSGAVSSLGTMYVFGAPNLNGGGQKPTVSAAFTGSPSVGIMEIAEYTGVNLGAPLDVTSIYFQNDSITPPSTNNAGPITTLQANDLVVLIGHAVSATATITAGGTQTLRGADSSANNFRSVLADMPAAAAGTFTPSLTYTGGSGSMSMDVFTLALAPTPTGGGIGTIKINGAAIPATVTNSSGIRQKITSPTLSGKLGQPLPVVFCDPNGNEYAITGATAGSQFGNPIPVVLCNSQGQAIVPTYTLVSNGNSIVVTATLTGVKRGQPIPVVLTDPNGFAYLTTRFSTFGSYVANPTPICLTDTNGNVLTLLIGN